MAPRTLASTWRQFEKLVREINASDAPSDELLGNLDDLTGKANRSRIVDALQALFVKTFAGTEDVSVRFMGGRDAVTVGDPTAYDTDDRVILLNPVGIVRFIDACGGSPAAGPGGAPEETFQRQRLQAYLAELGKLPSQMLLFLALLRQVGEVLDVATADRRGSRSSVPDPEEDRPYVMLLWAFKQLEGVFREIKGVSLRSEYQILWHESDWVTDRRH